MTKEFPAIKIGEHWYAFQEGGTRAYNDYYIVDRRLERVDSSTDWTHADCPLVIASTDPALGLPLIPAFGDIAQGLADKKFFGTDKRNVGRMKAAFVMGYRANKANWTDEDMRKAIAHGLSSFDDFDRTSNYDEQSRKEGLKEIQDEYLESLTKKPKALVIEMIEEDLGDVYNGTGKATKLLSDPRLKVVNGHIVIKEVKYND
jgi:hypothetical protein